MEEMKNNEAVNTGDSMEQTTEGAAQASYEAAPVMQPTVPAPENKPNNVWKFMIPIVVLIILVLILVGVAIATGKLGGGNGKKKIANAVAATFTESGDAIKEVWEMDAYKDMFADKQVSINADLSLEDELGFELQYDRDDMINGLYMDISYYGSSMIEALIYVDEKEFSLGLPNLTDYVFYVDRTTLNRNIQNLVEEGLLDEETAESIITWNRNEQDLNTADEEIKQGGRDILDAVIEIYDKIKVKKTDSKMLKVGGENRSCKGYVMTITGEQIADFYVTYKEVYEDNEAFQNYANQIMALELGYDSVEAFLKDVDPAGEFQKFADEVAAQDEEFEIYFYLYDGVIAQVYWEEDGDNYLEWNIEGGNFPLENTKFTLVVDGYENSISRNGSLENDSYTSDYALDLAGEELYLEIEYDIEAGDFDIDVYDYYNEFMLSGNIDRTIPGSELVIDLYSFDMDDLGMMYGDITISNECGAIEKPEGERTDIMELTEDDWYDILADIIYSMYY